VSYVGGGLSHLDVSPRATKSLRVINKLCDAVINDFLTMARADATYLFEILAIVWPQVRGLFVAGTITKKKYQDAFLRAVGPSHGFVFRRRLVFPGRAASPLASSKVYDVTFGERSLPSFFCPVGASADRPGEQKYFQAQVKENAEYLRSLFLESWVSAERRRSGLAFRNARLRFSPSAGGGWFCHHRPGRDPRLR
jgi:hypothetical protein